MRSNQHYHLWGEDLRGCLRTHVSVRPWMVDWIWAFWLSAWMNVLRSCLQEARCQ